MRLCEVVQQGLGEKVEGISRNRLVERYKPKFLHLRPHLYHCCNKDWKRRDRKISVSTKVQIRLWGSANLGSRGGGGEGEGGEKKLNSWRVSFGKCNGHYNTYKGGRRARR